MFTDPVGQEFGQCPERDGLSVVTVFVASTGKSGQTTWRQFHSYVSYFYLWLAGVSMGSWMC